MRDAPTETIFSLSGEAPGEGAAIAVADADANSLKPGAVVRGSLRHLCSVRKLTAGGAVLHLDSPVEPGERLTLDLATGQIVAGCVEWRRGGEVGIRFDEFFDVFGVIARDLASQAGERRRMPRIELRCPVRIESPVGSELAATRDVSQGGVKVETRLALQPEQPVLVELDGFRPLDGIVRWTEGGIAGIAFSPEPGWQEMMPWLRERRDRARRVRPIDESLRAPGAGADSATVDGAVSLNLQARVRDGLKRWNIEVATITTTEVTFETFAPLNLGALLWVVLPGLEGWPARIANIDGYSYTCHFTQPLHQAVLDRILAAARRR